MATNTVSILSSLPDNIAYGYVHGSLHGVKGEAGTAATAKDKGGKSVAVGIGR